MQYNIDPELRDLAGSVVNSDLNDPAAARAGMEDMMSTINAGVDTSGLNIQDLDVPGYGSAQTIKLRSYTPAGANTEERLAGLLQIHGGGFVMGSVDTDHASSVALARNLGVVVVSVDYRLAPEHSYPAALEDCYGALLWLHDNAQALGIDPQRVAVYGQSAGAGLAAALALLVREQGFKNAEGGPALCFQYLGMPELDDRLNTPSMKRFVDTPVWSQPKAELSWQYYLGEQYQRGADDVPALAAPARAGDLSNLPPAYISAMEFDPLRDEGVLFALKLMEAGVPVELHTFPGTFHGSALGVGAAVTKRQSKEMFSVLSRALKLEA